jgi:hypothetical protein
MMKIMKKKILKGNFKPKMNKERMLMIGELRSLIICGKIQDLVHLNPMLNPLLKGITTKQNNKS